MSNPIFNAILKMKEVRKGIPQYLLKDGIHFGSTIKVKTDILTFSKSNKVKEIDLIVSSPGGQADDAYRIIRTFRKNFETVNIIIPFWAKSAATLLSLGGSKIIMDEFGEFGPLDAQIGKEREDSPEYVRQSALNDEHSLKRIESRFKEMYEAMYIRIYEHGKINIPKGEVSKQLLENLSLFFKPLLKQIDPYKLGEKRRQLDIAEKYAQRILAQFGGDVNTIKLREFTDYLVNECPDHGFVIDYDMVSLFLQNVYRSDHFGLDYKDALTDLALILLGEDGYNELSFVGFVTEPEHKAKIDTEPAELPLENKETHANIAESNGNS